ncbi:response regulator transcription factor [Acinetobacter rudis]|uniref:Response regulator transcription factor n=1 Tax=Acinetobacter rudis TaxID=632955 RepID=A0AAW8J8B2_9GAMM|nr:response regulator transcription factor [Acinetobacter rudis]MDQ8935738.1 response regulator transcription factor [Acinetobacter rudis]MDQ8952126.1 response regulator transcription factor [Acinetobacter rudis]MDQ9018061.1 response regulator transcription factor [Acinetobacter rudis]
MSVSSHYPNLNLSSATILVVDDVPENLGLLYKQLDKSGFEVLLATEGQQAIDIAQTKQPDLILLDVNMPIVDGFECCQKLKAHPLTEYIPVIFMTGWTETEFILKGFQVGCVDYVTKPLHLDEVLARITTHLAHAKRFKQQQHAIDASQLSVMAVDQDAQLLWQTSSCQRHLLDHSLNDLQTFILHWLQHLNTSSTENKTYRIRYQTQPVDLQLRLLSPTQLDESSPSYLIEVQVATGIYSAIETQHYCPMLTTREAEVLYWVSLGKTSKDIGQILNLSPRTVNKHLENIFNKLGVETRTAAVSYLLGQYQQR